MERIQKETAVFLSSYCTIVCLQDSLCPRRDLKRSICLTQVLHKPAWYLDIVWQFVDIKYFSHFDLFLVHRGLTSRIYFSCAVLHLASVVTSW